MKSEVRSLKANFELLLRTSDFEVQEAGTVMSRKRCTLRIDAELLERLQSITERTGMSQSEQIRQGIRWWLEAREWPLKSALGVASAAGGPRRRSVMSPTRPSRKSRQV